MVVPSATCLMNQTLTHDGCAQCDLDRTFPNHETLDNMEGISKLRRLLQALTLTLTLTLILTVIITLTLTPNPSPEP